MAVVAEEISPPHEESRPVNYLNYDHSIKSWLLTQDHKRIGMMYLATITVFFLLGGLFALLFRLELMTPEGDLFQADTYNKLFTLHGAIMIFFFLVPSVPATLGNFLLPIMLGAKDLAFPKINLLSYYVFLVGGLLAVITLCLGGVDTGWTFYAPLSTEYANTAVFWAVFAAFMAGFSSILTGLNFIATVHKMRAPGLTWFRLPLFIWAHYATAIIMMLGTPVVAIVLFLVGFERATGIGIFDPHMGGDPVLFQHMFWFYSHPAVYVMILPGFGIISEVIACFSKNRVFGYEFIAFSSLAIAILGFFVWGHHMYVSGQSFYTGVVFSILTFMVAVPSAIKIFNWTATVYGGNVTFETPMIYAIAFMGLFLVGGLTGIFLSSMGMDVPLHDTYFVVAHFHFTMVGGMTTAFLAGIHFWWPKMTGRMYSEFFGKVGAGMIFFGFNLTFFPQFVVGWLGMPRRYHVYPDEWQVLNVMSTMGAMLLGSGFLLAIIYLIWSLFYGKRAPQNPWGAKGLEWEVAASPPEPHNFHEVPVVTEEAYAYTGKEIMDV
jgi:cytochrome c oxidase subunit I